MDLTSSHQIQTSTRLYHTIEATTTLTSHEMNSTSNSSTIYSVVGYRKYISDEAFTYIIISVMTVTMDLISILGIVTNIINIIVFIRQGLTSDSSTVSLFGLAIADLFSVVSTLWMGIFYAVELVGPSDLSWDPFDIMYMGGAWPHVVSGLITRMITALIAFERCCCVVFPFKVKNIFTPRSSAIVVTSIFAYFLLTYSPIYVLNTFHYVMDPDTNRTRLILIEDSRWQYIQTILSYANLFTLNFLPVVVVLVCTTITISRVNLSSAWRESMTNSSQSNHGNTKTLPNQSNKTGTDTDLESTNGQRATSKTSSKSQPQKLSNSKKQKEKKMVRMVSSISLIFLVCYLPSIATLVAYSYDKEIRTNGGKYQNLAWSIFSVSWSFDAINSSINIFIYYKMSSRYKKEFDALFGISGK